MKKAGILILSFILLLLLVYIFGPKTSFDPIQADTVSPISIDEVEDLITKKEAAIQDLKPGNSAKIEWFGAPGEKTEYSLVYLHGFSASHAEGSAIHRDFAKTYGCNLYLSRLYDHGRSDTNSFRKMTPQDLIRSAEFAIEVGKTIGEKVILMNCSTGATMGLYLAGGDSSIVGIFNYSPNIDIYGNTDELLVGPWGEKLADLTFGGKYNRIVYDEEQAKYWNSIYHTDGLIAMKYLINSTMTEETFSKIFQPVFLAYYYKNEEEQDQVVSVDRMLDFYNQISTPDSLKYKEAFPNGRHVMTSNALPSEEKDALRTASYNFAEKVMGLQPVK